MSKRIANILLSVISLTLGGLLYIVFRENSHFSGWFNGFILVEEIRTHFAVFSSAFLKYYFPDFLWGFSLACGFVAIYNPKKQGVYLCGAISFTLGCVWEALQAFSVVSGTGDFFDIMMYLISSIACIMINQKEQKT